MTIQNILIVLACLISFIAGSVATVCLVRRAVRRGRQKREGIGTMNLILIIVCVIFAAFTVTMIVLFCLFGSVPDTLITCVFGVLGGECGAMAWIRTTKDRHQERRWQIEDEIRQRKDDGS